jgi:hypothetical protein
MSRMSELHAELALRDEMERDAAPEMLEILKQFVSEYDAECACPDHTCLECTDGTTPARLVRGPCPYHAARSLLRRLGVQP